MLAGAHPQPRLDRVLARVIDLLLWAGVGVAVSVRVGARVDTDGEALSSGATLALAVLAASAVVGYEVLTVTVRAPSVGKRLFALRVEAIGGGSPSLAQAVRRAAPVVVGLGLTLLSIRGSIAWWWCALGFGAVLGLAGLAAVVLDRPTPWDRLAGTRVVGAASERRTP